MNHFILVVKILWLCLTVYFLVKDTILAYITVQTFLKTAELRNRIEKIPNNIALCVVNVVLAIAILIYV
jgi:hypothetical protein